MKQPWLNTRDSKVYYWNDVSKTWEPKPELLFADWNNPAWDGPGHCAVKKIPPLKSLNTENAGE